MSSLRSTVIFTVFFCVVYGQQNCNPREKHPLKDVEYDENIRELFDRTTNSSRCKLRDIIVDLKTEFGMEVMPKRVAVKRCTGIERNNMLSCMSNGTRIVTKAIRDLREDRPYNFYTFEIEEDTECIVGCKEKAEDCNDNQVYKKEECRCRCKDDGSAECNATADMKWDYDTCKCVCNHAMLECPQDYYWVPAMCECMRMMDDE